jgi:hypothetical protein
VSIKKLNSNLLIIAMFCLASCDNQSRWHELAQSEFQNFVDDPNAEVNLQQLQIRDLLFHESQGWQDSYFAAVFSIDLSEAQLAELCAPKRALDLRELQAETPIVPAWHAVDDYLRAVPNEAACMEVVSNVNADMSGKVRLRVASVDQFILVGHDW